MKTTQKIRGNLLRYILRPPINARRPNLSAERARRARGIAPRLARPAHLAGDVDAALGVVHAGHAGPLALRRRLGSAGPLRRPRVAGAGARRRRGAGRRGRRVGARVRPGHRRLHSLAFFSERFIFSERAREGGAECRSCGARDAGAAVRLFASGYRLLRWLWTGEDFCGRVSELGTGWPCCGQGLWIRPCGAS